eukprot:1159490-Pelagomonas_calceolata.AAC.4
MSASCDGVARRDTDRSGGLVLLREGGEAGHDSIAYAGCLDVHTRMHGEQQELAWLNVYMRGVHQVPRGKLDQEVQDSV